MAVKVFFLLCVEAVFAQTAYSQCIGGGFPGSYGIGSPYDSMGLAPFDGYGFGAINDFGFSPFDNSHGPGWPAGCSGIGTISPNPIFPGPLYGGGTPLPSGSFVPPASFSVLSENYIDGTVSVVGQLPFVASVSMSGEFPTVGVGAVSYSCGDGSIRIIGESGIAPPFIPAAPIDYTSLYPYGPTFIDDFRGSVPYSPDYGLVY